MGAFSGALLNGVFLFCIFFSMLLFYFIPIIGTIKKINNLA
ncbi:putative membrane protein [Escherichia coli 2848050]|nr:putative membrane protein [Escherichia coli 2848050]